MNKREILELLELAYAPADSTGDWLERFGMRLARSLDWAVLPFGYVFDGGGEGPPEFHHAFFGARLARSGDARRVRGGRDGVFALF